MILRSEFTGGHMDGFVWMRTIDYDKEPPQAVRFPKLSRGVYAAGEPFQTVWYRLTDHKCYHEENEVRAFYVYDPSREK